VHSVPCEDFSSSKASYNSPLQVSYSTLGLTLAWASIRYRIDLGEVSLVKEEEEEEEEEEGNIKQYIQ